MGGFRHYSADAKGFCHQFEQTSDREAWDEAVGWAKSNGWTKTTPGILELWDLGADLLVFSKYLHEVLPDDDATREQRAVEALEKCYGTHPTSTDHDRAWGLKASEEDAVLSILDTLYPLKVNGIEGFRTADFHDRLCQAYYDISCKGGELDEVVAEFLPLLDEALAPTMTYESRGAQLLRKVVDEVRGRDPQAQVWPEVAS